ncbi:alpha/beta hydrolase family protein [Roseimaritima ulvae]|uniref:Prolyl oligopeptidase family protein n=1 Tax=Roseimaritima ulvae TaxID=980254 RepID=A0A5B9QZ38_9BACT|nr:prolyl oligopeptidase family serine peptidase [Roseimaritima ulvae]QEG43322.1 Prolyl oligopeptidase family protein [Roseimaritima ulvae]
MHKKLFSLLVLVAAFSAGQVSYLHAQDAKDKPSSAAVVPGDDTRLRRWDDRFTKVSIPSSFDSTEQKAYAFFSASSMPQPLVVSLHSWSAGYQQLDQFAGLTAAAGWHYIHPDFRGPNKTPHSCASAASLSDIDDAIAYAIANANVDKDRIYVVGGSGGGHACCAISLKSRHRIRAAYAWVPITDIAAWYHQSKDRKSKYATDIESVLESAEDFYESASQRSPIAMPLPLKANKLHLFAGVRDGYEGSVPISHSLLFFNRLCTDIGETDAVIESNDLAALLTRDVRGSIAKLGERDVFFQRTASFGSVTIFDGAHEILHDACFEMLRQDAEGPQDS